MRADKRMKKELLHGRRRYAAEVASVLAALRRMDPGRGNARVAGGVGEP
jgi:hypothetical protein